jgi:hypothetical protein
MPDSDGWPERRKPQGTQHLRPDREKGNVQRIQGAQMFRRLVTCSLLAFGLTESDADAQWIKEMAKRSGAGASIGAIFTLDDEVEVGSPAWGINFALKPEQGLGPIMGFGWYEGDLILSRATGDRNVGTLRVRPVMAGIAYTWLTGRVATSVSLNLGVSFNSIDLDDQYRDFFGPGTQVTVDASNSFAVRPQIRFEYEVAPKFGIFTSAGYFFTEFDNVIETPLGRFENEWDASSFNLFVGVMVYPFR